MNLEDILIRGTRADQPLATEVGTGALYYVTDEAVTEQSDGSSWLTYSDSAGGGINQLTGDVTAGPGVSSQVATIANDAVTDAKLRNSAAVSIIGRSANSSGDPADIAAAANDRLLTRVADALAWTQLTIGMFVDAVITYAKIQNVSAADKLLGRGNGGGAGVIQEITLGTNLSLTGTTLNASAGGGGSPWTLINSITPSGGSTAEFTDAAIDDYTQLLLVCQLLAVSTSGVLALQVSIDGGTSWLVTSGDYKLVPANGGEQNNGEMNLVSTSTSTARTCWITITNSNGTTEPKMTAPHSDASNAMTYRIATSSPINGLRVKNSDGLNIVGTLTGGTIYLYGR